MNSAPLRVLLVDTDSKTITSIGSLLQDSDPPSLLIVAESLQKGIDLLQHDTFDVALVAHTTEPVSTSELLGRIRLAAPITPVIILTEEYDAALDEAAIAAGADDYLCCEDITGRLLKRSIRYAIDRMRYRAGFDAGRIENELARKGFKEREDLFHLLIENAVDVITLIDPNGTIRFASPSIGLVLGYPADEVVGRNVMEILHPDDSESVIRLFGDVLARPGSLQRIIFRLRHADGAWVSLETIGRNFMDDPLVGGFIINSRDVTTRIRLEKERDLLLQRIRLESERIEALVKGMPGAVWERRGGTDPLSHRITFMSSYIETMLGYTVEEFMELKSAWLDSVHPDDRESVRAIITGHTPPGAYNFVYRMYRRDGRLVWIKSNVISSIAENGEIIERGISLDITGQRDAEEALRESDQRFRVAINASSMGVFSQDRDLRYTWAYNTVLTPSDEMIGRRDSDLFDETIAEKLTAVKQRALDSGISQHEEICGEIGGVTRCFDLVIEPLRDHAGEIIGITGASFDLTPFRAAQEELRRSQMLFQTFMDNSPAPAYIKDRQKRYLFASNRMGILLDRPVEKILGKTNHEIMSPEDAEQYERSDDVVLEKEQTVVSVEGSGSAENRRYWYSVKFPVRIAESELMMGGMIIDITNRIRAEESLRLSEERFQLATRATNDVIWDWDLRRNQLWMSDNLETVFGYSPSEIDLDMTWWIAQIDPTQRDQVSTGIYAAVASREQFWTSQYRFRHADGSYADVLDRAYIVHNEQGVPIRMIGAMINISSVLQAEQALRESRSRLQALFEHAQDTIILANDEGRYIDVSPAACELTGYSREELTTRSIEDLVVPEQRARAAAGWKKLVESGAQQGNYKLLRKDGSLIDIEFRSVANIIPGLHLSIVRDITDRIVAERLLKEANDELEHRVEERTAEIVLMLQKLEQASQTQKRFIADASHDLRTPLTVLRAELDLMQRETTDPDLQLSLQKLIHESLRLDGLINDLLTLTTLESTRVNALQHPVRLDELMLDSAVQLDTLARRKGISWRILADDTFELTCDENSIRRMLTNLMENAVKYSRENSIVEIKLASGATREGRAGVEIIVRDNGAGIASDDLPHVFDRFYRGDTARSTPGTGLGLAIVKAAVDAHGGTVDIDSTLDVGTTVKVCLPIRSGEE